MKNSRLLFLAAIFFPVFLIFFSRAEAQVSPQSLLVNGDFESGISGTGFQVPSPFNYLPVVSGTSSAGDYAFLTNPQPMNTAFFISTTDHSGSGKMMVVDGTTVGGQQRFWKAGNTGGGVGPLTVGQTYTFSYWVLNVSTSAITAATSANIGVAWNNATSITLVSGNPQVSYPGFSAIWQKVVYSFVPSSNYVNIELYNNNTSATGNDFALDDLEVLPPPLPLSIRYSVINPTCPGASNGAVVVYGQGGSAPYQYSFNGGAYSNINIFPGLGTSTNNVVSVRDAALNVVSSSPFSISAPANPLVVRLDTSICSGDPVILSVSGSSSPYFWTASPIDPTLTNPSSASPTVRPVTNTTYTVASSINRSVNFIFNGDFSLGDVGFNSDHTYLTSNSVNFYQSVYGIVTNANNFETGFSSSCVDHTTGSGNMMVVDGATIPNKKVWQQTIPVLPNTNYVFSYWIQTVATPSPAEIETTINGQPITGSSATSTTIAPPGTCNWVQQTYTWNSNLNTTADITLFNRNINSNGNDFALDDLSFTTGISCPVQKSVVVTVNSSGTPNTTFGYASPFCIGGINPLPQTSVGFSFGGSYTSTAGLNINASTGEINLTTSLPGTYTVTYSTAASGCTSAGSGTAQVVINNAVTPVTGFSYSTPICVSSAASIAPVTSVGFTTGGTFSSTAGLNLNATTGVIDLTTSIPGNYIISYSLSPTSCSAAASSTAVITINPAQSPVTGFLYNTPICASSGNILPTLNPGFTAGGTFSSNTGLTINPSTGEINTNSSVPGSYVITYTIAAAGCIQAGSSTFTVVISSSINPNTSFSYASPVCAAAGTTAPAFSAGFTGGGVFSSSIGLVVNASSGVIDLTTSTPGSYQVNYNVVASGCQLAGSGIANIVVSSAINAVTGFSYSTPVCVAAGTSSPTLVSGFTSGGSFSASNGLSINSNTGVINLSASTPGTYTITYTVPSSGCIVGASSLAAISITANNNPVTTFSYATPVCITGTNPVPVLPATFSAGGTFSGSAGVAVDANTGVVNLAASQPGVYAINYAIAANGCNNAGNGTASLTIVANVPVQTSFSYPTPVCGNATNPVPQKANGFTSGGVFSAGPGLSIDPVSGIIDLSGSTAGNYLVTYTVAANACNLNNNVATAPIEVSLVPNPPATSPASRCGFGPVTLRANGSGILTWYQDVALQQPIAKGNSFTPILGENTTFFVTDSNTNCASRATPVLAIVNPLPEKPFLGNDTALCPGELIVLNAGNYTSYVWQDNSAAPTFTVSQSGIYVVSVKSGGVCSISDSIAVNVLEHCDDIHFPNAFTPDGDGNNDRFGPLGNLFMVKNFSLKIYNRWGQMVYSSYNPYQRWDGSNIGKAQQPANYTFVANYFYKGTNRIKKGNILLMR